MTFFPNTTRLVLPTSSSDVCMMTADRRYWTDPVWRRNANEFLRYFKSLENEVTDFIIDGDFTVKDDREG